MKHYKYICEECKTPCILEYNHNEAPIFCVEDGRECKWEVLEE